MVVAKTATTTPPSRRNWITHSPRPSRQSPSRSNGCAPSGTSISRKPGRRNSGSGICTGFLRRSFRKESSRHEPPIRNGRTTGTSCSATSSGIAPAAPSVFPVADEQPAPDVYIPEHSEVVYSLLARGANVEAPAPVDRRKKVQFCGAAVCSAVGHGDILHIQARQAGCLRWQHTADTHSRRNARIPGSAGRGAGFGRGNRAVIGAQGNRGHSALETLVKRLTLRPGGRGSGAGRAARTSSSRR